jgi:predicted ATPase with chaperone activity
MTAVLGNAILEILESAQGALRAYVRVLRVVRTIADLDHSASPASLRARCHWGSTPSSRAQRSR